MSFHDDVRSQSVAIRRIGQQLLDSRDFAPGQLLAPGSHQRILFTGMGASFFATYEAWMRLATAGVDCHRVECAELLYRGQELLSRPTLLVIVSQSGESIEVKRLIAMVRDKYPDTKILAVCNSRSNTLATSSDFTLATEVGDEVGVATKSFTTTLLYLDWLVDSLLGEDPRPRICDAIWMADDLDKVIRDFEQSSLSHWRLIKDTKCFYVLGRGDLMPAVWDGALVFSETCQLPAIGMHSSQFRHGPMEAVGRTCTYFVLIGDENTREVDLRLAQDIMNRGGQVQIIGDASLSGHVGDVPLWTLPVGRRVFAALWLLPLQLLAGRIAEAHGFIPGRFRFGGKVVLAE